jgi:hypothetical protein
VSESGKKLPIGIASFSKIAENNYIYADKTKLLYDLIRNKKPYFLSRPRRFGKTLLISALAAILRGERDLFKGLWIDGSDYDFTPNPLIHFSLAASNSSSVKRLESGLSYRLKAIAESYDLSLTGSYPEELFLSLLEKLYAKYGKKVAVLIDEYDTPILNQIEKPAFAEEIRETLRSFYGRLKDKEIERGFTLIAGVTRFPQTFDFFGLNNLDDLTLDQDYANICGFTLAEFDALFSDRLEETLNSLKAYGSFGPETKVSDLRQKILDWYDGYSWDGATRVLNPWAILNFFKNKTFDDYWTQSGDPSYIKSLVKKGKIGANSLSAKNPMVPSQNILNFGEGLDPIPLLFQSGYLTATRVDRSKTPLQFFLDFPNFEVRANLIPLLISVEPFKDRSAAKIHGENMIKALVKLDAAGFGKSFEEFLSLSPFSVLDNSDFTEERYKDFFWAAAGLAGESIQFETLPKGGIQVANYKAENGSLFIFGFKRLSLTKKERENPFDAAIDARTRKKALEATRQIESRNYAKLFRGSRQNIYKVAIVGAGRSRVYAEIKKLDEA